MKKIVIFTLGLVIVFFNTLIVSASGLNGMENKHPRVIIDISKLDNIIYNCETALKDVYEAFIAECEEIVGAGPVEYYEDSSVEELWMRDVGDSLVKLSFAYLTTKNESYAAAASEIVAVAAEYPSWGRGDSYRNKDLACAHMLFGVSAYYDWCYDTIEDKESVLELLIERGNGMYNSGVGGWWRKSYLQNHLWINAASLMVAGAAIYDDAPDTAETWMSQAETYYEGIFNVLPRDGSTVEGFSYWQYGMSHMIYYLNTAKNCGRENYLDSDFVKNTGFFVNYMMTGEGYKLTDTSVFNFADCDEVCSGAYIAELSYLSALNNSAQTQWFVNRGLKSRADKKSYWKVLLYYDSTIDEEKPDNTQYPCDRLFSKTGYGFMRSDWEGDYSALAVHSGRAVGLDAPYNFKKYHNSDLAPGHLHPDMNHISLHYNGYKLLSDDGYTASKTADHNTLIINGAGQYGEEKNWITPGENPDEGLDAVSEIKKFISNEKYAYAVCDATAAYKSTGVVNKFKRHILFVKKGAVIVIDNIELADTTAEAYVQYFSDIPYIEEKEGKFLYDNTAVSMEVKTFGYGEATVSDGKRTINKNGGQKDAQILKINNKGASNWIQPVAFSYTNDEADMYEVLLESEQNGKFLFVIKNKNDEYDREYFEIDLNEETAQVREYDSFNISVDSQNRAVNLSGTFYYGENAVLDIVVTNENKDIVYIDRQIANENNYDFSFVLSDAKEGVYEADIYSSEHNRHMSLKFGIAELENKIDLIDYSVNVSGEIFGNLKIKNNADVKKTVMIIIAKYDSKGRLIACKNDKIELQPGVTEQEINSGFFKNNDEIIRIFIWDNKLRPQIVKI